MNNKLEAALAVTIATIAGGAILALVPCTLGILCQVSSGDTCGWWKAIPTWAIIGAIAGFATGLTAAIEDARS